MTNKTGTAISYGPRIESDPSIHRRWVENVSDGLRFVGFADDLNTSIQHSGWFTDDHCDNTYRGVVYRLPTRKGGNPIFVYGYTNSFMDDFALLEFSAECDCSIDAARWADNIAEYYADLERDFQRIENAKFVVEECDEALAKLREGLKVTIQVYRNERDRLLSDRAKCQEVVDEG